MEEKMTSVGSYEAKTHLPELLERVARGEKIVITKHGRPMAMLVPPEQTEKALKQIVTDMLAFRDREGPRLGPKLTSRQHKRHQEERKKASTVHGKPREKRGGEGSS